MQNESPRLAAPKRGTSAWDDFWAKRHCKPAQMSVAQVSPLPCQK